MTSRQPSSRAFVAVEAIAITMVSLVFIGIILVSMGDTRRQGRLNRDLANLRQIGAWTFTYANDYEDLHPSFSSAPDSQWPELRPTGIAMQDAAKQAIDIIRRRTGRTSFPLPGVWIPHILYTHLVLSDYAQRQLPDATFVSTGDKHRLNWLDDPINKHDQGFWQPFQNPESGTVPKSRWRWPYSASFQTPPAWFHKNEIRARISQISHAGYFVPSSVIFGGQPLADVAFPAQKVMVFDYGAWHFTKQAQYFASETARVALLMGDGGASARVTADSNKGWNPTRPSHPDPTIFLYRPRLWEPPVGEDIGFEHFIGHYRWTRDGIEGRDFDGPEVNTGQR